MGLFDRIRAKISGSKTTSENGKDFQSTIKSLLHVQLSNRFDDPHYASSTFMTDTKAAGYLFGFHDAMAQHIYGRQNKERCMAEIRDSYEKLFGPQAGYLLMQMSMHNQEKPEFQLARVQGGTEMYDLIDRRLPPLGLKNHLAFGDWKPKNPSQPVNPLTKFEQTISTWDPQQAKTALAILAATVFQNREPLESLFGKGAKVEAVIRQHITVGQLRVLHSTMKELVPDFGDDEDEDD
jgi:hypothetical protein